MHQILQAQGGQAGRIFERRGRQVFVSGQVGWNACCQFTSDDLVGEVRQALLNIVTVLQEAGAQWRSFQIAGLAAPGAKVETQAIAVIPE